VEDCGVTGAKPLNRSRWPKANDEGATVLGTNAQKQRTAEGCVLCTSLQEGEWRARPLVAAG
jgi:hypothetical protein